MCSVGLFKHFFNNISRYIDDLLAINNNGLLNNYAQEIYPSEMVLEQQNPTPNECTFLDLRLRIVEGEVCLSMYDKRDDFPFPIVKFTNASSNVDCIRSHDPIHTTAYRELQANDKFSDFSERVAKTIQSMLAQNLMWDIIEKNLRKFLRSHPFPYAGKVWIRQQSYDRTDQIKGVVWFGLVWSGLVWFGMV